MASDGKLQLVHLAEGDSETTLDVPAASVWRRSYLLEGQERIAWKLQVQGNYDVICSSKVSCSGQPAGSGRVLEITERERGTEFEGYLDLSKDHSQVLRSLGAAPQAGGGYPPSVSSSASGVPMLTLELDNTYSYFTGKRVSLQLSKTAPFAAMKASTFREALEACEPNTRWEHALRLLGRLRELRLPPDLQVYNAAMAVCRDALQWEPTLRLLEDMRAAGLEPDSTSYEIAASACERCGQADRARELLGDAATPAVQRRGADDGDVAFLRSTLREAVSRCPPEARALLGHLLSAQESLEHFVTSATPPGDASG